MRDDVLILTDSEGDESTRRLLLLIEFMGLKPVVSGEWQVASRRSSSYGGQASEAACVLVSADALVARQGFDVCSFCMPVLVYGFRPCDEHLALASQLSDGAVSGLKAVVDGAEYRVATSGSDGMVGHFAGIEFGPANPLLDSIFCVEQDRVDGVDNLVSIGGDAFFVKSVLENGCTGEGASARESRCTGEVYLLGVAGVADVGRMTDRMPSVATLFSSLVCFMMFVRHACRDRYPMPISPGACVIIDDPLLRTRYGFICYEKLLKDLKQHNYAVTVSHVPKNSGMTAKTTAQLFAENADRFSICVHGCDHMRGEFSTEDEAVLSELLATSLALMSKHESDTGVSWDHFMVFPHGLFSVAATKVLKAHDLLGFAVSVDAIAGNSNPRGTREATSHRLSEFLMPVMTAYGGAPLFLRRSPKCIEEFAFDLLLERPLLITTHHRDFKNGAYELNKFVDRLNRMEPNLKWTTLAEIVKGCIVRGCVGSGQLVNGQSSLVDVGSRSLNPAKRDVLAETANATFFSTVATVRSMARRWLMILRDNLMAWKEYMGDE